MIRLHLCFEDGCRDTFDAYPPIVIGRGPEAQLRLRSWRVARQHARLERRQAGIFVDDLGALSGTFVNGQRVTHYGPLSFADEIVIGPCQIRVSTVDDAAASRAVDPPPVARQTPATPAPPAAVAASAAAPAVHPESLACRRRLHQALLDALDLRRRDIAAMSDAALKAEAATVLDALMATEPALPEGMDKAVLIREVVDEAVGLGLLEPLLADPEITEIMVNRHDEIYVERFGRLARHGGASAASRPSWVSWIASSRRWGGAWMKARPWSMPGSPTVRASMSCCRPSPCAEPRSRSANFHCDAWTWAICCAWEHWTAT